MPASRVLTFTDPQAYQAAIRAAQVEILPTAKGDFRAELTQINLHRLWMQRGRESLPRIYLATVNKGRAPIGFLTDAGQPAIQHCGMHVSPGDIIINDLQPMHRRSHAPCSWGSISLTSEDLAAFGESIAGRELTVPAITKVVRPAPMLMARLLTLHEAVEHLAKVTPDILARPEVAHALEQELLPVMIRCLTEAEPIEDHAGGRRHAAIIARLEELLAANHDRPLYLAEICAATGASERTLRACCQAHLGMGPVHYLWLRRMHLARLALGRADAMTTTVTQIATDHGFWELGRFAVEYRNLFGELPSATLRRPPSEPRTAPDQSPFELPLS